MLTESPRPDIDAECSAGFHPSGIQTRFRIRAFVSNRLVVVSDAPSNKGASVTNAVERVAVMVEAHLDVRVCENDPADWSGWQIVQFDTKTGSLELVRFAGRDAEDAPQHPTWSPLPVSLFAWLYAAV